MGIFIFICIHSLHLVLHGKMQICTKMCIDLFVYLFVFSFFFLLENMISCKLKTVVCKRKRKKNKKHKKIKILLQHSN